MSFPIAYDSPYVRAVYEGRDGTFTLDVFGPDNVPPESPEVVRMAGPPDVAFGEVARAFGGGLIPWSVDFSLLDPSGHVAALLEAGPAVGETACRLSGPDGHGGTFTVWTRPMPAEEPLSASPRITPDAPVGLVTHDGLAALDEVEGTQTTNDTLADVLTRLWLAMPGDGEDGAAADRWEVWAAFPIAGAVNTEVDNLQLKTELAGVPGRGDFGTAYEQLRALAEGGTLSVYQPSDADPDEPRWEACPRSRVGTALACRVIGPDGVDGDDAPDVSDGTFPDRAEAMPPYFTDPTGRGADRVRRVGTISLEGTAGIAYDTPATGVLNTGVEESVYLDYFPAVAGVRFFVEDHRGSSGAGSPLGSYRLELVAGGTTYYGPDWSTSTQAMPEGTATTADLPAAGDVTLYLVGETSGPSSAQFSAGAVRLVDPDGDNVTDYAQTFGSAPGQPVALRLLPTLQTGSFVDAGPFDGLVSGGTYGTVAAVQAAERIAQQAVDLRQMTVEVVGLYGPQARFTLGGSVESSNPRSPWPEDVVLVPTGGVPDVERGTTVLSLIATTETPAS